MPRKAEVDEPFLVEPPGHFFEDRDAARVVLDQVVIGREDRGDALLGGEGWDRRLGQRMVPLESGSTLPIAAREIRVSQTPCGPTLKR